MQSQNITRGKSSLNNDLLGQLRMQKLKKNVGAILLLMMMLPKGAAGVKLKM